MQIKGPAPLTQTYAVTAAKAPPAAKTTESAAPADGVQLGSTAPVSPKIQWNKAALVQPKAADLASHANASFRQTPSNSVAELASRYFSADEFQALNSGSYHNFDHPIVVADAAGGFAHGMGWSPERKQFIQQVALLHDADDRSQVGSDNVKTGSPARAQVTLEWMDQQKGELCERFGWQPEQFTEAKALIARTDFPFDDKPRNPMGTKYDGQSPLQVYKDLLSEMPKSKQAEVLKDGLALRFADQAGFYAGSFDMAVEAVEGLCKELQGVGVPTNLASSLKVTPGFLASAGKDNALDTQLAQELGHQNLSLPGREELLQSWDPGMGQRFLANSKQFELMGQAIGEASPEKVQSELSSLKDTARSVYRMTTGLQPT
ncbi:MAG: hypothetical protein J0I12_06670 [Candidatus Eremiobacteraeota bacterium]|nr:hypothetical protein [Candidatus Eremiobacteraeota bacterium]